MTGTSFSGTGFNVGGKFDDFMIWRAVAPGYNSTAAGLSFKDADNYRVDDVQSATRSTSTARKVRATTRTPPGG